MSDEQVSVLDQQVIDAQKKADTENATRTGVGPRVFVGKTRGKNPIVISYESFDESIADSMPKTMKSFMDVTGKSKEDELLSFLIDGWNAAQYTAASDPLAEFVEATWPDDAKGQFRIVVRNYSRAAGVSLEDAVTLIKPGFNKQFGTGETK